MQKWIYLLNKWFNLSVPNIIKRCIHQDFDRQKWRFALGHMLRTKSGLLERRWGVGGEVKTERNALSLFLSVLSVGTVPTLVAAECCHYVLWRAFTQRPTLCVTAFIRVCVCVKCPLSSATFNLQRHFKLVCAFVPRVCVWALTDASLLLSRIKNQRHIGVKRWERNSSGNDGKKERNR